VRVCAPDPGRAEPATGRPADRPLHRAASDADSRRRNAIAARTESGTDGTGSRSMRAVMHPP